MGNLQKEQSETLVSFLNQQSIAQAKLLTKEDFQASIEKKVDKDDIKLLIVQMDTRFEATQIQMNTRFEALQLQMDKRFEQIGKHFETMQQQMNKRFDQADKHFETMQKQMDKRFEQVDKRFEQMDKRFETMQQRFDTFMKWSLTSSIAIGALITAAIGSLNFTPPL